MILTLSRCWWARKPAYAEQNDRTSPTSGRLPVDERSICRWSCTKDWYSALHASTSLPLVHPFSKTHPRTSWTAGKERRHPQKLQPQAGGSSYPVLWAISRQRLIANNSSRRQRTSRRNSVRKYWLPIMSSAVITRVPERKSFSSVAGNRE